MSPESVATVPVLAHSYDAIVVGGGPAGATAAILVAQAGHRVLMVERDRYPRFKIGESLIPATTATLERIGMVDLLRASNFPEKHSVQFFTGSGRASAPFYFAETEAPNQSQTWQVLRSEFDQMLFDHARRKGVEAHQGVAVKEVLFADADEAEEDGDPLARGVRVQLEDGSVHEVASRVVIDATGQRALIARQLGLRTTDPNLRQASIYTHFKGARRDQGIDEGATLILQTEDKKGWFWFIPLPDDVASVGVVGQVDDLIKGRQGDPQVIFDQELARCPGLLPRLEGARQLMPVQVVNEFSYQTRQAAGPGWVLCGDAFGFLDPMYSTGVLLALRSGEMAADCVIDALAVDDPSAERLGAFVPTLLEGMAAFRKLVYAFYHPEFSFARFLKAFPEHRLAVVKILVGDVFDRDFSALFRDLDATVDLPREPEVEMRGVHVAA